MLGFVYYKYGNKNELNFFVVNFDDEKLHKF